MSRSDRWSRRVVQLSTALCGLSLALACVGCSTARIVQSSGSTQWSGLGVTLTLPPGAWRIEPRDENAVLFSPQDRAGNLLLERVQARAKEPDWLALKKLFSSFEEKKEISRRVFSLAGGAAAQCAEYDVKLNGAVTRVRAFALRRGAWFYEIAEWGFDRNPPAEAFLASLAAEAEKDSAPRSP